MVKGSEIMKYNNKKIIILLIFVISFLSFTTLLTYSRFAYKKTYRATIRTRELTVEFENNGSSSLTRNSGSIVNITDTHSSNYEAKYVWSVTNDADASEGTLFNSGDEIINSTLSGTYYLCVYVEDDKGFTLNECSNEFIFDNTAPSIEFTYDGNDVYKHSQSSVITVTNDTYGAELDTSSFIYIWSKNIDDIAIETFTSGEELTISDDTGDYYIIAQACDSLGNCSTVTSEVFKIDNDGPEAAVTSSTTSDSRAYISYTATDNESGIVGYNITTSNTQPTEWIPIYDEVESTTEVKQAYGATWARIFHHNNKWGELFFSNATEAGSVNTIDKYSVLNNIEKYRGSDNKFEFLLEYPDVSDTLYNRWKQTGNPTTTTIASGDGSANAPGYEAVHVDWTGNYWGGLVLSNANTATFIDGSVGHGNWFYAIGAYTSWSGGIPGPNSTPVSVSNLWVRIDGLTETNKKTTTGKIGDIKTAGKYYVWFKDETGNISNYEVNVNVKSILKINPNGGTWNGKTTNSIIEKDVNSYFGIANPTRTGYTFAGWTFNGGGPLLRGNASGNGSAKSSQFTETVKTDTDGNQYTNYKYTNVSVTSATWPSVSYPSYAYTSGHRYRITVTVRLNAYDNLAYLMFRHSAFGNDWGGTPDYASFNLTSEDIGKGWKTVSMERTFTGTTINRSGTDIAISPRFEIYSGINANTTASVDFDIKNIVIEDITSNTLITNDSYGGNVYKYGYGNGLLTANWTANNYTVTCEDWFVDASNNRKVKLGSSTKTYAYGTSVSGTAWGTDGATSKYYSGYAYKSATSGTVPANNNLVVYRYFYAWTDLNIFYAGGSTQGGATVALSTNNSNYTDVTNESNTVQPYGTTYYIKNIRPKNSYEELDRVQNLTWNSAGYYTYTPTAGGTSMNIYMKYKTYTITYNLNSGSVSGNPTSYTYATAAFTLKNPTRSGYTFTGWTGTGLSAASTSVTVPTHSTGNRSYTANWKQNCTFGVNSKKEFGYTGGVQSFTVPTGCGGTYKLEVWGAQGGNGNGTYQGGKGGYASGSVSLAAGTTVYVVVGGQGATATTNNTGGGYNGGGNIGNYAGGNGVGGGGGATHIGKTNALLKNTASGNLYIVAGGGGGGRYDAGGVNVSATGGAGGGSSGGNSTTTMSGHYASGGSQSAAGQAYGSQLAADGKGAYGQGGAGGYNNPGGGGGYYGGGGGNSAYGSGGGGGSGYTGGVSGGSMSNGQRTGSGYARITRTA